MSKKDNEGVPAPSNTSCNILNDTYIFKSSVENDFYKNLFPRFQYADLKDINGNIVKEFIFSKAVDGYNHIIHAEQCGSGKTTEIISEMNSNSGKDLIIGDHQLLSEISKKINKQFVHLEGFERLCTRINEKSIIGTQIKYMFEAGINKHTICTQICKKKCQYRLQFKEAAAEGVTVGMPIDFIHTYDDFSKFNNIYIEERVQRHLELNYNSQKLMGELGKLRSGFNKDKYITKEKLSEISKIISTKNYKKLCKEAEFIKNIIFNYNIKTIYSVKNSLVNENFKKALCSINIDELIMFLEFEEREKKLDHKYERNYYKIKIPNQQMIFYKQMKHNKDIRYNCATFNKLDFLYNLDMFEQMFPEYVGKIVISNSFKTNCQTAKIKHFGDIVLGSTNFDENFAKIKPKVSKLIDNLKNKYIRKVCVLTFKEQVKDEKFMGCPAFYFGANHGSNEWRDFDTLIVLGTYMPNIATYKKYFNQIHPNEAIPDLSYYKSFGVKIPEDELMRAFYVEYFEKDVYDSVHRIRPLEKEDVRIYWFGMNIPEKLVKELGVENTTF